MNKKTFRGWIITSAVLGVMGLICLIVKFAELSMRTDHAWAKTFLILGFVFIGLALLVILGTYLAETIIDKKKENAPEVSDDDILEKYKSKNR